MFKAGKRWGDISFLLGGWSNTRQDGVKTKWQPDYEVVRATIKFAIDTGRLEAESGLVDNTGPGINVGMSHASRDRQM
jgi:hypothetical protein